MAQILRSRADLYEMGEKIHTFPKYEKRNKSRSHVRKLLIGDEEVLDHGIILKELLKHYSLGRAIYHQKNVITRKNVKIF